MSMPYYASAEQIMRDRSEYARKGIARGRSVVVLTYADGVLFVAENTSSALHKVVEIYDRIGFAAVGKYNEFENLRVAGIRLADLRGYSYDRRDVTARALANAYAQTLGSIFTEQPKPYEVELCVAEVGAVAGMTSSTGCPTTAPSSTSRTSWRWAGRPTRSPTRSRSSTGPTAAGRRGADRRQALGSVGGQAGGTGRWSPTASRSRCSTATGATANSAHRRPRAQQPAAGAPTARPVRTARPNRSPRSPPRTARWPRPPQPRPPQPRPPQPRPSLPRAAQPRAVAGLRRRTRHRR